MLDPTLHAIDRDEFLKFHKEQYTASYNEFQQTIKEIEDSNFHNFRKLLKRGNSNEIESFCSFLAEVNLVKIFLRKNKNISYEPYKEIDVDFVFDKIWLSVKNINAKKYERDELAIFSKLSNSGGDDEFKIESGEDSSLVKINVLKHENGIMEKNRIEISNDGVIASDIEQLSNPIEQVGFFESIKKPHEYKKVILFGIFSNNFRTHHIKDIGYYYFGRPKNYRPLLSDYWYEKMFKKEKGNTVDAIIFIYPSFSLIWPKNYLSTPVTKNRDNIYIFTENEKLRQDLMDIFK